MNEPVAPAMSAHGTAPHNLANSWLSSLDLKLIADRVGTPVFIYSEAQLIKNVMRIKHAAQAAGLADRVELFVPFFPNSNPHILTPFQDLDVGILLQLPSEYKILDRFGFDKFIVSPGHVSDEEISYWCDLNQPIFLSSIDEVSYLIEAEPQAPIYVRLDSLGSGKPGIKYSQLGALRDLLEANNRKLHGFELYCGSGNSVEDMIGIQEQVFMIFKTYFAEALAINFAGGYSFEYEELDEGKKHFNWDRYFSAMSEIAKRYEVPETVKLLFEPARDLLGDVGALLLSIKRKAIENPGHHQILTNGSRVLMPSAQYKERDHNVIFLDPTMQEMRPNGDGVPAVLRGRGILRHDYVLPGEYIAPGQIGPEDFVVILDVGSYCATQHMEFLNIPPAAEVIIDASGRPKLITDHGNEYDKWRHLLDDKRDLMTPAP